MPENSDFNVDDILKGLFQPTQPKESLKELFNKRVQELNISPTAVLDVLRIQHRTLNGVLTGTQKTVDFTNLIKIADFLQLPKEHVIRLYLEELEKNFPTNTSVSSQKVEFIKDNFDLVALKKAGFIDSINNYDQIEKKITSFLALKSIFDYKRPPVDTVAFSAGLIRPRNDLTRSFWIESATDVFKEINNPYKYDRQALVEYFPQIRWHSTSVELGLINIIRDLFKIGVTVIYQSSLPSLHLRGATFSVNDKPCVAITDIAGFYPTLWFALVHELFHVLFDWEEIKAYKYHISDEDSDQLKVIEKEREADNFAREYLFSKEKTEAIRPRIYDYHYVNEFAKNNHVHPSFIYVFNAYDIGKKDRTAWAKAKKQNPDISKLIKPFENPWDNPMPIPDFVNSIKYKYYY